ncbi:unnamed protein product [Ectocarpus sp. CCAP 1310/34]|nr:unnamed protein product [Ectocarpus sp. CCAP 1310/34]
MWICAVCAAFSSSDETRPRPGVGWAASKSARYLPPNFEFFFCHVRGPQAMKLDQTRVRRQ